MALEYPIKHWLGTLAVGPVIVLIYDAVFSHNNSMLSGPEFYVLIFLFGLLFSLPSLLIYYFCYKMVSRKVKSKLRTKMVLLIIAIVETLLTLYLIGGTLMNPLMISYSAALVMTAIVLKIGNESEDVGA